jgi:hypothetical protein
MVNMRTGFRAALAAACICLTLPAAPAIAATPVVSIEDNSADINTFQALSNAVSASKDKDGSDFIRFGESLVPSTLKGGEGKADTFAQQATTVVTPSVHAFPTAPIFGIGLSGRVTAHTTKANNALPGVPVADSVGSMSADFSTNAPTPFQFSGAMVAANNDPDDCTQISVELTGPVHKSFSLQRGGGCTPTAPNSQGFVVTGVLPAGGYSIQVQYEAEVTSENPGSVAAGLGEVDTNLQFLPPDTELTRVKLSSKRHQATFRFKAVGTAKGVQCALVRGTATPTFTPCRSPKTYKHLKRGSYTFEVRAVGRAGPDATPAIRKFKIK